MVTAIFEEGDYARVYGLWQWDYGQELRIQGLNLPTAVEIHFSLTDTGGESVTRVGVTKDGVTSVVIPDSMLEGAPSIRKDSYPIYAFIYLTDEKSGETTKQITLNVKCRPKPEAFDKPEDGEIFREAIKVVNDAADRAETAAGEAKESAKSASEDAAKTETDRKEVERLVESVSHIDDDVKLVESYKNEAVTARNEAVQAASDASASQTAAEEAAGTALQAAKSASDDMEETSGMKQDVAKMQEEVAADRQAVDKQVTDFTKTANQAVQAVKSAETTAVSAVTNAGAEQMESIQTAGQDAVQAVNTTGERFVSDIQTVGQEALDSIDTVKNKIIQAVTTEGDTQVARVQDAAGDIVADREQIAKNKEDITALVEKTDTLAPGIEVAASGEQIVVQDAADGRPFRGMKVFGKSTQVKTTGAQLFDGEDIVIPKITSGSGYAIAPTPFKKFLLNLPNGEYSYGVKVSKGTSNGKSCGKIAFQDSANNFILNATNTFTLTDELKGMINVVVIYGNIGENITYSEIMVNAGQAKPYEPYTGGKPSPSIEYPQEIKTEGADGQIDVDIHASNLFPSNKLKLYEKDIAQYSFSVDGEKVRFQGKGSANKEIIHFFANRPDDKISLPPGKYILSFKSNQPFGDVNGDKNVCMYCIVEGISGNKFYSTASKGYTTFTINKGDKLYFRFDINNDSMSAEFYDIILNGGDVQLPYVPYKEPKTVSFVTPTGLPGIPVSSGGNYTDESGQQWVCDEIDLERGKYVQRVWKKTTEGSESWNAYDGWEGFHAVFLPEKMSRREGLCNYYKAVTDALKEESIWLGVGNERIYTIKNKYYDANLPDKGMSNWKAFLNENPMTIMSYLSEPIETDLPPEVIEAYKSLHTYAPTTIVSNDADAGVEVKYIADTKTYIDNKFAELNKAILDTVGGR